MTGMWPEYEIDHKDTKRPFDDSWNNLREATHAENARNRKISINNSSGYKGVSYSKFSQKWQAQIQINHSAIHLGYFSSREDAYRVYCERANSEFGEFFNP